MYVSREQFFAALSHPVRLRTVLLLQHEGELCVCDLTRVLNMAQPAMSRQLGILREAKIVEVRKDGLWVHYRINTNLPAWAQRIIEVTAGDIGHDEPYHTDRLAVLEATKKTCIEETAS